MSGYTPGQNDEAATGYQRLRKPFTSSQLAHALEIAFQLDPIDQTPPT
jgi:hypothetical protein